MSDTAFRPAWEQRISSRKEKSRLRTLACVPGAAIDFASNDYLGLRHHPDLLAAGSEAAHEYGSGSGASRLVTGNYPLLNELESNLAVWLGFERALVFSSGWQMNVTVLPVLAGRGDTILIDRLAHNSLLRGALSSGAEVRRFRHNDVHDIENLLIAQQQKAPGKVVLVTESLFSMDGDIAPLEAIHALCERYQALLVVDEAHALGVFGAGGAGLCSAAGVKPDVLLGTFGKSFGSQGAFAAAPEMLVTLLINEAEGFIYSTAPSPFTVGVSLKALSLLQSMNGERAHIMHLLDLWKAPAVKSHIIPVVAGSDENLMRLKAELISAGFSCGFIRPPTVPENSARLRISLHAFNTAGELSALQKMLTKQL
jgi:8-amino-7-oxononanoate synthase